MQNKYSTAKGSNIKMELAVQLGNDTGIDDLHLCSIFSNLIDNALEACQNISDPTITPYIIVKCYEKAGFLIISVKNSKQNDIMLSKAKMPLTNKTYASKHGLGLTIVDSKAKMHNGDLRLHYTKYEFEAIAALGLKPQQEAFADNKDKPSLIRASV